MVFDKVLNLQPRALASPRSFHCRFVALAESTRERRAQEVRGGASAPANLSRWRRRLTALSGLYPGGERVLVRRALSDPYFPMTKYRQLNAEGFAAERMSAPMSPRRLTRRMAVHLSLWARTFLAIRRDVALVRHEGRPAGVTLGGSPQEGPPEGDWCDLCGCCCEIRGGLPDFPARFAPPRRWIRYFHGDLSRDQRFCPFLLEYFATSAFVCSIYDVKPRCCSAFDREECVFLKADLARERGAKS
ncbi:MAG TPA: hypothetical protein VMU60_11330 [Syntrophobacteria bacterium]|nr:hypothetical protein [Syntrophobacteria bacterium]